MRSRSVSIDGLEGGFIATTGNSSDTILEQVTSADLRDLYSTGLNAISAAKDLVELEAARVRFLGRKAGIVLLLRNIADLAPDERREVGRSGNLVRSALEAAVEARRQELESHGLSQILSRDQVDITLPGWRSPLGRLHLVVQTQREIEEIFIGMGYEIVDGPEVETEYYNFEALNTPADHPARSLQDTFFVSGGQVLRTQTSPVQVRTMELRRPPMHVIAPGKVYRRDSDATHTPMFHQVEGLVVDEGITLSDLKGTLVAFAQAMFGVDRRVRLRPHFFPFTEPSVEVDVSCMLCGGAGCRLCRKSGWLEILGAGMVDPAVYGFVNYDAKKLCGFAFGLGVDRFAMLKYGIDDVQLFFQNDVRFLRQFA